MAKAISSNDSPFENNNDNNNSKNEVLTSCSAISRTGPKSKDWKENFLAAIMEGMSVTDASKYANVHPTMPYKAKADNEQFRRDWKAAAEIGVELLEQEAIRRAYHGVDEPVFYKGEICGYMKRYSDPLMMFLLKAHNPEKYKDSFDSSSKGNTVLNINVNVIDKPQLSEAQVIEVQAIEQSEGSGEDDKRLSETVTIPTE